MQLEIRLTRASDKMLSMKKHISFTNYCGVTSNPHTLIALLEELYSKAYKKQLPLYWPHSFDVSCASLDSSDSVSLAYK